MSWSGYCHAPDSYPRRLRDYRGGPVGGSFEIGIGALAEVEGVSAADSAKTTLKLGFKVPPGQRPLLLVLRLRAVAREALQAAGIPLV